VTKTYYDVVAIDSLPITQENLRKRVTAVTYEDTDDNNGDTYNHGTFYSYDIHGNVKTLLQDNPSLTLYKQRFKKVDYEYDLISGKVNNVYYEKDSLDAFAHHYEYDADNKITEVYTSAYPNARWTNYQNNFWENDAKYFYYDHGPLARVEYGENHVNGADYYYTIQGWIKGVNSNILTSQVDGGQDGLASSINKNVAKDAYGYTLGYFQGDYSPIDTSKWNTVSKRFEANTVGSSLTSARYNLYNGNISHMVTTLIQPDTNYASQTILPQGTSYKYDQLNRLTEMKAFINITNNAFGTTTYNGRYNNRFAYDANGNILSQVRKKQNGTTFDSLTYRYKKDSQGRTIQNRLYHVNDTIAAATMSDDVDNQGTWNSTINTINSVNNYSYDKIGNLVRDSAEGIATIDWTVYGKIKSVTHRTGYYRLNGTDTVRPPDLAFNYDAAGNRISKIAKPRTATTVLGDTSWTTTHYVRDAQGNVMSVYTQKDSAAISTAYFKQTEKHVYGSSRLGIDQTSTELLGATFDTDTFNHSLGNRSYELSNHLGNVLTTLSDKRMAVDTNANDTIDYYVADIRSATDYAAFGAPLEGRTWNSTASRYGFNGQEKDDEIKGAGNLYDFGERMYDPRLGRFASRDPLSAKLPWNSPYSYAANNPVKLIDKEGMSPGDPPTSERYTGSGNVAIIIARPGETKMDAEYNMLHANGWDYVVVGSLQDANTWLDKTYGNDDKKVNNLVLAAHGNGSAIQLNTVKPNNTKTTSDDGFFVNSNDFEGKDDPKNPRRDEAAATADIDYTGTFLSEDAKVLVISCQFGSSYVAQKFANAIGADKNLTVYTSSDYVGIDVPLENKNTGQETGTSGLVTNKPLIEPKDYKEGWNVFKSEDGKYNSQKMPGQNVSITPDGQITPVPNGPPKK
jgi:RHS repeat-associated protein